jgi:hypothetical protein
MPESNEVLLDLISQSIRIERPSLTEERSRALASEVKSVFESLNGGIMQLEDATQSIVSLCLSLLSKTKDLTESSGVLVSSYDLIIEKIDSIVARINTAVRESDALLRQSLKFQSIVEQNLSYTVALPTKLVKSMESALEKTNTLTVSSVTQSVVKVVGRIVNSFRSIKDFINDPFRVIGDAFSKKIEEQSILTLNRSGAFSERDKKQGVLIPRDSKDSRELNFLNVRKNDTTDKKSIASVVSGQANSNLLNERALAGITNIPLSEQVVLNKTTPGVAVRWLARRLERSGLMTSGVEEAKGGIVSNIKDKLLEGLGLASGMHLGRTLLPKLVSMLFNPWVLGAAAATLGGVLLWKFRKPIGDFLGGVKDTAGKLFENIKTDVSAKFDKIKDSFVRGWESSIESLKVGWGWVTDKWESVRGVWSDAVDSVRSFWDSVAEKASSVYDRTISPLLKNIDDLFGGVFSGVIGEVKKLKPFLDNFSSWLGSFRDSVLDFVTTPGKKFIDWLKSVKDAAVPPKEVGRSGVLGYPVGRDARERIDRNNVKPEEKNIKVDVDLNSMLKRQEFDVTKSNLSRVVDEGAVLKTTYDVIKRVEAGDRYDAVNLNDAGAVSLGVLQWRADRARDYLKRLAEVDPKLFRATMGDRVFADLKRKDWSARAFSTEESQGFAKLLEDPRMRTETDKLAVQDISKYFRQARELGIQNYKSLSLAASMINQYGFTGFKNLLESRLQTTDFEEIAKTIREDARFPYRTRRLEEIELLDSMYRDFKILKEDVSRTINIPQTLESYQQSVNSLVTSEIKTGLKAVSDSFAKSISELKAEVKEAKGRGDDRGMVDSPPAQVDRSYVNNIPRYIMEMIFGLNIGGEDKKLGGIF